MEAIVKRSSIDRKILHEYFHNFFTKPTKNSRHASLKRSRSITQTKRHTSISISSIRTSKSSILLIFIFNNNLRENRITIKKTKVSILRQSLKHLINKRQMIMIFSSSLIKLPKINAHSISYNHSLRNEPP